MANAMKTGITIRMAAAARQSEGGVRDEVAEQQGRAVEDEANGGIGLHLADGLEPRDIGQPAT
jgi:hypothetical protein